MKNTPNLVMPSLSFHWQASDEYRAAVQKVADDLMLSAIRGGMKPEVAKGHVEDMFSAGWAAGQDEASDDHEGF